MADFKGIVAVVLSVIAVGLSGIALAIPGGTGPAGPQGPPGAPGSGFETAFLWGHAVVIDCNSSFVPGYTTFVVHYVNLGTSSAYNSVAHYAIATQRQPTVNLTGEIAMGIVPALTAGNVTETAPTYSGCYGGPVDVWFTWS